MKRAEPRPGLRYRPAQVRALPDVGEGVVEAYVTVYDAKYSIGWGMSETILPGAFDESLAENNKIPIFWQHAWRDAGQIIGDGQAESDDKGIRVQAQLYLDSDGARNVYRSIEARSIREWSIGFYDQVIERDEDDEDHFLIHKGELIEASSVVRGANPETETVSVRHDGQLIIPHEIYDADGRLVFRDRPHGSKNEMVVNVRTVLEDEDTLSERILEKVREELRASGGDVPLGETVTVDLSQGWARELVREQLSRDVAPSQT